MLLLEPYSYGLLGKLAYLGRLIRGMYHLRTAGAVHRRQRLPAGPCRAPPARHDRRPGLARGRGAEAVRGGHAGAARRAGADLPAPPLRLCRDRPARAPERRSRRRFGRRSNGCWRSARRGPTSSSTSRRWPRRGPASWPRIRPWPGGGSCSTRRRSAVAGRGKRAARRARRGRDSARPCAEDHALVLKTHPNLRPGRDARGRLRRGRRSGLGDERLAGRLPTSSSPTTRRRSSSRRSCDGRSSCWSPTSRPTSATRACTSTTARR